MLASTLIHPDILHALGKMGHGSQILISDGNFPHATHSNPNAPRVFLNLSPGVVGCVAVLDALVAAIPLEAAQVMAMPDDSEPPIWKAYRERLPQIELTVTERFAFYAQARQNTVGLLIATAEEQRCANLLLTIGIVKPDFNSGAE